MVNFPLSIVKYEALLTQKPLSNQLFVIEQLEHNPPKEKSVTLYFKGVLIHVSNER